MSIIITKASIDDDKETSESVIKFEGEFRDIFAGSDIPEEFLLMYIGERIRDGIKEKLGDKE